MINQLCIDCFLFCDQLISLHINIFLWDYSGILFFKFKTYSCKFISSLILTSLPHSYWVTLICHCLMGKPFNFFSCWFFLNCQSNFPLNLNYKWWTKSPGGYSWSSVHVDVDVVAEGAGWYKHVLACVCATDHCNSDHDENSQLLCDAIFVTFAP